MLLIFSNDNLYYVRNSLWKTLNEDGTLVSMNIHVCIYYLDKILECTFLVELYSLHLLSSEISLHLCILYISDLDVSIHLEYYCDRKDELYLDLEHMIYMKWKTMFSQT